MSEAVSESPKGKPPQVADEPRHRKATGAKPYVLQFKSATPKALGEINRWPRDWTTIRRYRKEADALKGMRTAFAAPWSTCHHRVLNAAGEVIATHPAPGYTTADTGVQP